MKLKRKYLQRYREIARLLWKYGRSDLVMQLGMDDAVAAEQQARVNDQIDNTTAEQLADDLEAMGPTYVKLGQVLSGRPDLIPQTYIDALVRLQDKVKPFAFEEVKQIVESEIGVRLSKGFSYFDEQPMAAASLGQVHRAALRDGREVVVKVQRPNIASQIAEDFEVLAQIATFLEKHNDWSRRQRLAEIVEQLRVSIQHELDYDREAQNLMMMGRNMEGFTSLYVPQPINDFCTRRVLTMEYVPGVKITSLSPLARMEMDGEALAEDLFRGYLKQVLVDGLFHADPHPGNVFVTQDGHLALLDLGMVGRTTPGMQEQLLKLLIAVSEGKGEQATDVIVEISTTEEGFDTPTFKRQVSQLVAEQHGQSIQQINVGRTLLTVVGMAAQHGVFVPTELTLLAKTLLQLDEVGKILDPDFDPNAAIRRNVAQLLQERMRKQATQGSLFSSVLELKDFAAGLPARLNRIMDSMTNRDFEVKVRTMDADMILDGLQKIANRITSGLILAALIIGAALLMRVETTFVLLGYPGLAMLFFLFAACGSIWLLMNIFIQDQRSTRKVTR
jgi:predicted unusual protein kinase regulating ubiquinone biosynthesis (AarF/ABC1/UbiB family)